MLNIYNYVLIALSIVILAGAAGAEPVEEWNRTYGDTGEDFLNDLRQTADGGYIISGRTCLNSTPPCEGLLIRTDANGNVEWKRTYSGPTRYVRQTMDGGYIVASDNYLIRTEGNGSVLWNRTYDGRTLWTNTYRTYNGIIRSVLQTGDGGYIVAGSIENIATGHLDAWLLRTDADGGELWSKKYGGVGNEHVTSFQRTPDGGYLLNILGWSELFKTDAEGNELWNRKIKPAAGYPNNGLQTRDGGYVMAGSIEGGIFGLDAWLARTDADFNIQFSRQFRESQPFSSVTSVIETSDGGYLMVVNTNLRATSEDNYEMGLIRTDNNGSKLWSRRFGGGNSCVVQQTQDGGYVFGCTRFSAGLKDIWITKFESDMNLSSLLWATPVYSPDELGNHTEIPAKYRNDINEGEIKAVLDAAAREIRTFDGSRYESIRANLSLTGGSLRDNIRVKQFLYELDGYRGGRKESWQVDIERQEKGTNTSVIRVMGGGTLVPDNYMSIAKGIALKKMDSESLNRTPELTEASWIINRPGMVVLKLKDPKSPAHAVVTVDLRNHSVYSVEKKYWFQPSFPIFFNITSNPDGADVYLAKGGLGDLCGGPPYKLGGDLIGKTPLTYKYEYDQTFMPFSGLFSLFSFNLTGYEDAFKCINIYGGESAGELSVSIHQEGSLEPVLEAPLTYNISAGLKPQNEINRDVSGFDFVFPVGAFLLIYLLGSRKIS